VTPTGHATAVSQALDVPAGIETPSLVIDLDILDHNLAEMAGLTAAAGVELWPHVKTHRTLEYARRQLAAGAAGLTVSRLEEAEAFAAGGASNLLLAYPLVGEARLARARLLSRRATLTLATDSLDAARAMGTHFAAHGGQAAVFLIINTGMDQCGVAPAEAAPLARQILARVVAGLADRWSVSVGEPFEPGGQCSWTAPATGAWGAELVLKVGFRFGGGEERDEAAGLRAWDGNGTVRLKAAMSFPPHRGGIGYKE
jgi:voltage-gated potassium channel Kch